MKATASIGPPLSQADAAQTEESQQGCQPTDRHIDEEDHLPTPVRQELTANPRPSDPAQRSQRANEASASATIVASRAERKIERPTAATAHHLRLYGIIFPPFLTQ